MSAPPLRVLIVGAGAVGQVYGHHLQQGGAHVEVLVRPKYAEECAAGLRMYAIRGRFRREARMFKPDAVLTSAEEASKHSYDQVWLCVSTTAFEKALRDDLPMLLRSLNGATLVVLQPGSHVPSLLAPHVPRSRIVDGLISMIAYQAPLVDREVPEPGVAFWLQTSPFTGDNAESIVGALNAGGCPARVSDDTRALQAHGTATLMPIITALQGAGWKLSKVSGEWATLGANAAREARAVTEATTELSEPVATRWVTPTIVGWASRIAPRVAPLDLEVYLRYHFTKVGDQTQLLLRRFIDDGKMRNLPVKSLETLRERVFDG